MAAPTYLELLIVLQNKQVTRPRESLDAVLEAFQVDVVPFTAAHARIAQEAYLRYGRGSGHPAKLNFGDCVSYALAKASGQPLLFKGDDFPHTDLKPA